MYKLDNHPEIIKTKNIIDDTTNLTNYVSHILAEYYCNLDMVLEYTFNDHEIREIEIYVEGEDLLINWHTDIEEYVSLESNKKHKHTYDKNLTYPNSYKVTIFKELEQ